MAGAHGGRGGSELRRPHAARAFLGAVAAVLLALAGAAHAEERVLNVYNWTDYIDPAVIERFTRETGVTVRYDTYDSLETLEGKLLAGNSGYDVVVPTSEPTFSRLIRAGALQPLDRAAVPHLANEDPALLKRVESSDPGNRYGAIYLWGTIGLGEIPDEIKALDPAAPLDSWALLLDPVNAKRLAPCGITMMDSATDVIPSVLRYAGHDPDSTAASDLADVEKALMAIRPFIRTFSSGGAIEAIAANETCLAFMYSGDAVQARARAQEAGRKPVAYAAPREFAQLSFDMLAIPKDAPHAADANRFINFLLQPDVMAAITNKVRYPNALPASRPLIRPDILADPNIYPPPEAMARFFTVHAPSQAAERARTRMWARFKAGQ
jgi:putrescine transport system substrate-binding protein